MVAAGPGGTTVLHGPAVLGPSGEVAEVETLVIAGRRVVTVGGLPAGLRDATHVDAAGLAITPGLVDAHAHLSWATFFPDDDAGEPGVVPAATREILSRTLARGVLRARDAGGLTARVRDAARAEGIGPEVDVAVDMIRGDEVDGVPDMRRRVRAALGAGATWVKLVATHGVAVPGAGEAEAGSVDVAGSGTRSDAGVDMEPLIDRPTMRAAIEEATAGGARVMVHAWGGPALSDAIELGAASIEHGMFLTEQDAAAAAAAGCWFVPTVTIYRDVADMARAGELPPAVGSRALSAAAAHPDAVSIAREAGVSIAAGTDFSSLETHGKAVREIASLVRYGMPVAKAWHAATVAGHALLDGRALPGRHDPTGPHDATVPRGLIAPGARADLVAWAIDPTDPESLEDGPEPAFVVVGGRLLAPRPPAGSTS